MRKKEVDLITRVLQSCIPLKKYESVIDWYEDFKKKMRDELKKKK